MAEARTIKRPPDSFVYVSLLPEYAECAALHECDLKPLAQSLADLDRVSRRIQADRQAPLPIERTLARYLTDYPAARQELLAATACRLTAYMPPGDGRLDEMTRQSSFDAAVSMLPTSPLETLELERLTQIVRRVKGDPQLQLRQRGLRTVPDSQGASIVFPPAEAAIARAATVCAAYTACRGPADLRLAVWVLAALLNAHPCPDGNGRLSRLLFAGVLTRMGLTMRRCSRSGLLCMRAGVHSRSRCAGSGCRDAGSHSSTCWPSTPTTSPDIYRRSPHRTTATFA